MKFYLHDQQVAKQLWLLYHILLKNQNDQNLDIDFTEVLVMTPSWLSEYVQTLHEKSKPQIKFLESDNPSVISSIQVIQDEINE